MEQNDKKYIFLDVDGVLNNDKTISRTPKGFIGVSGTLVNRLKKIVKETNAVIILSSSWRVDYVDTKGKDTDSIYLRKHLGYKGLKITDFTTTKGWNRGEQIKQYITEHNIEHYVILDDEFAIEFKENGLEKHFVNTYFVDGLTNEDVEKAINILKENVNYKMKQWEVLYNENGIRNLKGVVEALTKEEALEIAKKRYNGEEISNIRIDGEY